MPFSNFVSYDEKTSPLFLAEVIQVEEGIMTCERAGRLFSACRGNSLLIDPLPGDQAVVIETETGLSYVIATVSSSPKNTIRTMTLPGETEIRSPGQISIRAGEKIRMATGQLEIEGRAGRIRFSDLSFESGILRFTGNILSFAARKLEQIAQHIETTAHMISQRAHMSTREITTVDRSVSGQTLIESESLLSMGSKNTIIRSKDWVKIDSDQIHLG